MHRRRRSEERKLEARQHPTAEVWRRGGAPVTQLPLAQTEPSVGVSPARPIPHACRSSVTPVPVDESDVPYLVHPPPHAPLPTRHLLCRVSEKRRPTGGAAGAVADLLIAPDADEGGPPRWDAQRVIEERARWRPIAHVARWSGSESRVGRRLLAVVGRRDRRPSARVDPARCTPTGCPVTLAARGQTAHRVPCAA